MSWPGYEGGRPSAPSRSLPPSRAIRPSVAGYGGPGESGRPSLGGHFDDVTWARLLVARGWQRAAVGTQEGFVSPPLPGGLRILFAVVAMHVGGLDDSPLLLGFREAGADADELYRVTPFGDGELIFDKLLHAGGAFRKSAFLDWLTHQSVADAARVQAG